jgi:hypothetical protein
VYNVLLARPFVIHARKDCISLLSEGLMLLRESDEHEGIKRPIQKMMDLAEDLIETWRIERGRVIADFGFADRPARPSLCDRCVP